MMSRFLLIPLVCLALAGCLHVAPVPSTGFLPEDAFGNSVEGQDQAMAAVNDAMIAFAYPDSMRGKPAEMALAIASLDAMAGQFSSIGRWAALDAITKQEMLDARSQVRGVLGVPESAPSQSVIDHLVAASHALDRGDQTAALTALSGPDFTKTPEQTLAILTNFPKVPSANKATMDAYMHFLPVDRDR